MVVGALSMAAAAAVPVGPADDATKKAVQEVKRGIVAGRGNLVYRNADVSTRVSNYYSFNVFEQRNGRWVYAAASLP